MRARLFAAESRRWWTLAALVFALFMIMLDNTVVNVALPSMQRDLRIGMGELEWVVSAYALVFAVLMLTGGKLGDLVGRRRIFLLGLALFTAASAAGGLAGNAELLIAARAVQGVGAALMMPSTLSLLAAAFPHEERGTAIGIWAGVSAMALAVGPLVGGLVTEHLHWSWIFFLNVPIGIVGLVLGRLVIAESRDTSQRQSLDLPGLATSGGALFALTYGLIKANDYGWTSAATLALLAAAAAGLLLFVRVERRRELPLLDLSLFRSGTFTGANLVGLLITLAMFGVFFFVSLYMQQVLGYSASKAGLVFMPMTALIVLAAPVAGKLSDRVGARWPMSAGMLLLAASLALFSRLGAGSDVVDMLPALLLGGVGVGLTMPTMTAAALAGAPVAKAGVASGVLNTFRQVGGALGIAVMGAILATRSDAAAAAGAPRAEAFVAGLSEALRVGAALALAGALVAALLVRRYRQVEQGALAEALG